MNDYEPRERWPKCIAYREDGRLCGAPAVILDQQRGGMVCRLHQPDRPAWLSVTPQGTLEIDVPLFIREVGLRDTPAMREEIAVIALEAARQYFPDVPVFIALKQP